MSKGGPINEYGLSVKQEKFAQLMAEGYLTQTDAYLEVFKPKNYKQETVYKKASALARSEKIKGRIETLKNPVIQKFRENQEAMAQSIIDAATKAEIKKGKPDYSVRHKAAKTGLDYLGYEAPKKNLNLNANAEMTKEDVDKLLENL